jgi:hypothetical protein
MRGAIMEPGFYCGTLSKVYPVQYCDIPDVRIYDAWGFLKELQKLKPGWKVYGAFNLADEAAWNRIPERLKRI